MAESTKALNQSVSTLKKNPARVKRLVKAAGFRIVPAHRLVGPGAARKELEDAILKLKAKRGLNGSTGPGAGYFAKTAADKRDVAVAAGTTASGAVLGAGLSHDRAKARVSSRRAVKNNYSVSKDVQGVNKRLAQSATASRRMAKPLRRVAAKGGVIGAAIGAGLGAANMMNKQADVVNLAAERAKRKTPGTAVVAVGKSSKLANLAKLKKAGKIGAAVAAGAAAAGVAAHAMKKEAGVVDTLTRGRRAAKAFAQMKTDDARRAALVSAAKKTGLAAGVAGAGYAVTKKNEQLKKQAAALVIKDGKKYRKGTVASAATKMGVLNGAVRGVLKGPKAALKGAANGALLGGAYGTVRGANRLRKGETSVSEKEMKKLTKKAAELLYHNGEAIRRGTIGSATEKMAIGGAILGGLGGLAGGPVGAALGAASGALGMGMYGGLYGLARHALRSQDGEKSMAPQEFDKLKHEIGLGKQAAELIIKDGKKYRRGTVGSAAAKMAVAQSTIGALSNYVGAVAMRKMTGLPVSPRQVLTKNLGTNLAVGGAWGAGYGAVRGHFRNKRGEQSLNPGHFDRMKAGH